jgi:hypothetical protein
LANKKVLLPKLRRYVVNSPLGWPVFLLLRARIIYPELGRLFWRGSSWLFRSREYTSFTYNPSELTVYSQAAYVHAVSGCGIRAAEAFARELLEDEDFARYIARQHADSDRKWASNAQFRPGHRLINYMLVRALKPELVVEAGVDKGLGAAIICNALNRNVQDGKPGDFIGIEYNPIQSCQIFEKYHRRVGKILRGDSVEIVRTLDRSIDLFFHETTSEQQHVEAQLAALSGKMTRGFVLQSPFWAKVFYDFGLNENKNVLVHQDDTLDHYKPMGVRVVAVFGRDQNALEAAH